MFRTLDAQRQAGFRSAWFLWSDDKTAERIYNGAGFRGHARSPTTDETKHGPREWVLHCWIM